MPETPIAIVGAGWAGLAAAVELTAAGRSITLIDAAPVAGGRAREVMLHLAGRDVLVDNGQHLLVGAYRDTLSLAQRVWAPGAAPLERHPMSLRSVDGLVLSPPAHLPAPLHWVAALLTARRLSPAHRWAMVRLMGALRLRQWRTQAGETVDGLLRRYRQPRELVDKLWDPLCIATLNTPPQAACAAAFALVLRDTLGSDARAADFMLPRTTLGDVLPSPATDWLTRHGAQLQLRTPVTRISREDAWILSTARGPMRAHALILAVPPANAVRLLTGTVEASALDRLAGFEHEPIATGYLAWPAHARVTLPHWIMLNETPDTLGHGQWLFDRGEQAGLRIASVVVSARGRALAQARADDLATALCDQVTQQLRVPAPMAAKVVVERRATFRCTPGRPRLWPDALCDAAPGLWLAGDHAWADYPATLEGAVRSGLRAAALCIEAQPLGSDRGHSTPGVLSEVSA